MCIRDRKKRSSISKYSEFLNLFALVVHNKVLGKKNVKSLKKKRMNTSNVTGRKGEKIQR